jgi:hypothetical protein
VQKTSVINLPPLDIAMKIYSKFVAKIGENVIFRVSAVCLENNNNVFYKKVK